MIPVLWGQNTYRLGLLCCAIPRLGLALPFSDDQVLAVMARDEPHQRIVGADSCLADRLAGAVQAVAALINAKMVGMGYGHRRNSHLERVQKSVELLLLLIRQFLKVPRQIHVACLRLHFVPADRFVERER